MWCVMVKINGEVSVLNLRRRGGSVRVRRLKSSLITVHIPNAMLDEINDLVFKERYRSRSEFIREAVDLLLLLNRLRSQIDDVIRGYIEQ